MDARHVHSAPFSTQVSVVASQVPNLANLNLLSAVEGSRSPTATTASLEGGNREG